MCFFDTNSQRVIQAPHVKEPLAPQSHWELLSPNCATDLALKKIAVSLIAVMNFAALGIAAYYIVNYCPIPTQALIASPFIVGVLGALTIMKLPTFGISSGNCNPAILVGKGMAYLFFGPLMYAVSRIDWTPYHDPIHAYLISRDLKDLPFEQIAEKYGDNLDNLIEYGFINPKYTDRLQKLFKTYHPIKKALEFWKTEGLEGCEPSKIAQGNLGKLRGEWITWKQTNEYAFPNLQLPNLDFSDPVTGAKLLMRKYFCFNTPFDFFNAIDSISL